jgi:hypothetical protein
MTSSRLTHGYRRACAVDAGKAGIGGRHNALGTDAYELIRAATLARRQVLATYKGYRRELCPHVLGTKEGRRQPLFF